MTINHVSFRKLSRNQRCWCGSGKKFKHCHENRHLEKPYEPYEIAKMQKKYSHAKYCLHPKSKFNECSGPISKSHTIQIKGGLNLIARDSFVYGLRPEYLELPDDLKLVPKLIGIKKASTFTGFCNFHDSKTFDPIENHPFESNTKHTFLLAYRAICKELYHVNNLEKILPFYRTLDRGYNLEQQKLAQYMSNCFEKGVELQLNSLKNNKHSCDQILLTENYSSVKYYVLRFASIPEIMCSGIITPDYDFNGNKLRDTISTDVIEHLTFSIIATDNGGAVVFSWINEKDTCTKLLKSFDSLSGDDLPHAIIRFAYSYVANLYFSPFWWEHLSLVNKEILEDRILSGLGISKISRKDCLLDDGVRLVNWKVLCSETNL